MKTSIFFVGLSRDDYIIFGPISMSVFENYIDRKSLRYNAKLVMPAEDVYIWFSGRMSKLNAFKNVKIWHKQIKLRTEY